MTTPTRRQFLASTAAAAGSIAFLPYAAHAAAHSSDTFSTAAGDIVVNPVDHASFVMTTPAGVIYADPVGDAAAYADYGTPDLILITHEHGDHYNADTLAAIVGDNTQIIANPIVFEMMTDEMKAKTTMLANGESATYNGVSIDAIPAYNITEERLNFHPEGRDNGYVVGFDDFRVYISGDTEDTPEMRALENIDLAFVCMNLPFTMGVEAAGSAVAEFAPTYVYPYHYRGRDNGTQDPNELVPFVGEGTEVKLGNWYGGEVMPA